MIPAVPPEVPPGFGSVTFTNRTEQIVTLGLWGPNAPAILAKLTGADLSQTGSPYGSVTNIDVADIACSIFRISYVGGTGNDVVLTRLSGAVLNDGALFVFGTDDEDKVDINFKEKDGVWDLDAVLPGDGFDPGVVIFQAIAPAIGTNPQSRQFVDFVRIEAD